MSNMRNIDNISTRNLIIITEHITYSVLKASFSLVIYCLHYCFHAFETRVLHSVIMEKVLLHVSGVSNTCLSLYPISKQSIQVVI
jgi:hypothetical protein